MSAVEVNMAGISDYWEFVTEFYTYRILLERKRLQLFQKNPDLIEKSGKKEKIEEIEGKFEEKCEDYMVRIADSRLKECQATMKIGWEIEKKSCQALYKSTQKLITIYNKIYSGSEEKMKQLELFVNSVKKTIEDTLEEKVDLDFSKIYE